MATKMTRRCFGRRLGQWIVGGQLVLTLEARGDLGTPEQVRVELDDPRYAALLTVGGSVKVAVDGYTYPVIVVRLDEERFAAYSSCCTHWGCEVDLPDREGIVKCPCHESSFDIEGRLIEGLAVNDLPPVDLLVEAPTAVARTSWGRIKNR